MAGQERSMEGSEEQKQKAGREAKAQGKKPSEVKATTGASKQRKEAKPNATHQEKMDLKHEGKRDNEQGPERARPGNRESDPKRTDRWG